LLELDQSKKSAVLGPPLQVQVIVISISEPCGTAAAPVRISMPGV
jgi:hypothetical protein